jgi:anti-sigma factor RsiW
MSACTAEWNEQISALVDGELSSEASATTVAHVARCPACAAARDAYESLSRQFAVARNAMPAAPALRRLRRTSFAAGSALLAAALVLMTVLPRGLGDALAADVERHHFRAFAGASPCDFTSSDPQRVKQWVERAVGYDIVVPEVDGATLLGARRCKLRGVPTAALLFRRNGIGLTVFVVPPGTPAATETARFASDTGRCTAGRLGEPICALHGERRSAVVVGDVAPEVLLAAARGASR